MAKTDLMANGHDAEQQTRYLHEQKKKKKKRRQASAKMASNDSQCCFLSGKQTYKGHQRGF